MYSGTGACVRPVTLPQWSTCRRNVVPVRRMAEKSTPRPYTSSSSASGNRQAVFHPHCRASICFCSIGNCAVGICFSASTFGVMPAALKRVRSSGFPITARHTPGATSSHFGFVAAAVCDAGAAVAVSANDIITTATAGCIFVIKVCRSGGQTRSPPSPRNDAARHRVIRYRGHAKHAKNAVQTQVRETIFRCKNSAFVSEPLLRKNELLGGTHIHSFSVVEE